MEILYRLKLGNFIANGNEEIQKLLQPTPTSDPITGNEASASSTSSPGIFQGKLHIFIASCRLLLLTIRCHGNSVVQINVGLHNFQKILR